MTDVADGVVLVVFGVRLVDEHYEAERGSIEFRGGRLVRLQIGHLPAWDDPGGLTIGFTLLPTVTGPLSPGAAFAGHPAVTRAYARGVLAAETEHDAVFVNTDRL